VFCVCVCVCVCVCACARAGERERGRASEREYMRVCTRLYIYYICVCAYTYEYIYITCAYAYTYEYIRTCIYTQANAHVYCHIFMCIVTYSCWSKETPPPRFHDEIRRSHFVVKSLTHGSWSGNILNTFLFPPGGGGFFRSMCIVTYWCVLSHIHSHTPTGRKFSPTLDTRNNKQIHM